MALVHTMQYIFINAPITSAYRILWQMMLCEDAPQAYCHYFSTTHIKNKKKDSFERQISIRNAHVIHGTEQVRVTSARALQKVSKNDQLQKITYSNVQGQVTGEFHHKFQQNSKGQVYLIFTSSAWRQDKNIPQKSQIQIEMIKLKQAIEEKYQMDKGIKDKKINCGLFNKCM